MFKKNRHLTYIILIIVFSVIFFFEKKQFDETLAPIEADDSNSANGATSKINPSSISQKNTGATADSGNQNTESAGETAEEIKKFQTWFISEASTLERRTANPQDKETELRALAKKLTASEINLLKEKSYALDSSANERILSTYLLSLGTDQTTPALIEISERKLSLPSPQPVHSTGETQLMQEKAIRTMAIDELFSRAKADPARRSAFFQMANQISDASLRNYALKRYAELK